MHSLPHKTFSNHHFFVNVALPVLLFFSCIDGKVLLGISLSSCQYALPTPAAATNVGHVSLRLT